MLTTLGDRFGYRGLWLITTGTAWILFGVGNAITPIDPRPWVLHEYLPGWLSGIGWALTGAVAIWQGSRRSRNDVLGHVALYLMPALRVVSYGLACVLFIGSSALHWVDPSKVIIGYADGWYAALVWAMFSLMLAVAASWPNPNPPLPSPPDHGKAATHG